MFQIKLNHISIATVFLNYLHLNDHVIEKKHHALASGLEFLDHGTREHYHNYKKNRDNILFGDKFYSTGLNILSRYEMEYVLTVSESLFLITKGFANKPMDNFKEFLNTFALWQNIADFTKILGSSGNGNDTNIDGNIFMLKAASVKSSIFKKDINLYLNREKKKYPDRYELIMSSF